MSRDFPKASRRLREDTAADGLSPDERVGLWRSIERTTERTTVRTAQRWGPARYIAIAVATSAAAVALWGILRPPEVPKAASLLATAAEHHCLDVAGPRVTVASSCGDAVDVDLGKDHLTLNAGAVLEQRTALRLVRGRGRFSIRHRPREQRFRLHVSHGVITVLGTVFEVEQADTSGRVELESGSIRFEWSDGKAPVELKSGENLAWGEPAVPSEDEDAREIDDETAAAPPREDPTAAKRKRPGPKSAKPDSPDLGATLSHVYSLRSQRRYDEAISILRELLASKQVNRRGKQRLSYEIGQLLQISGNPAAACDHWRGHRRAYPKGAYTREVEEQLAGCP